jgi:hypothetical protein
MGVTCCWIGGARYRRPLDQTSEKKFLVLSELGRLYVIGFSGNRRPARFTQHADFYLLPQLPVPFLRYLALLTAGTMLSLWLVLTKGVQILIAQSPYEGAAAVLAKRLAALCGKRVVVIVESHGDYERSLFLQRRISAASLYRWLMRKGAGYALGQADALRAVSDSTSEQLMANVPGKPIVQFAAWTDFEF